MIFQQYIPGKVNLNEIIFHVPIGSAKKQEITSFHLYAPVIKYVQHKKNPCCFGSLAYYLFDAREHVAEHDIALRLESYSLCESYVYMDGIKFSNQIMTDRVRNKGEQINCYNIVKWKKEDNLIFLITSVTMWPQFN